MAKFKGIKSKKREDSKTDRPRRSDKGDSGRGNDREDSNKYFDRSKPSKRSDKGDSRRRGRGSFEERGGKHSGRESRGKREFTMTKVICSSCGENCEVPFKPTSNKPIFCSNCFRKEDGRSSHRPASGLEDINKKLDKIMLALKIK